MARTLARRVEGRVFGLEDATVDFVETVHAPSLLDLSDWKSRL
jgi:hypothetical protein